jgi:hypothetical protein
MASKRILIQTNHFVDSQHRVAVPREVWKKNGDRTARTGGQQLPPSCSALLFKLFRHVGRAILILSVLRNRNRSGTGIIFELWTSQTQYKIVYLIPFV